MSTEDPEMCYVGVKACGCMVAAIVDLPQRSSDIARLVGRWIREGLTVEHVTCDYVRQNLKSCPHKKSKEQ